MATCSVRINGKQYTSNAAKDDLRKLTGAISQVIEIQAHVREISGTYDDPYESISWHIGATDAGGTMADPEGWARERDALLARIPDPIKRTDIPGLIAEAKRIFQKHVPFLDKRETADQAAAMIAERNRQDAEYAAKRKAQETADQAADATTRAEYPHLQTCTQTGKNDRVTAGINMRAELARAFPGCSLSVRSETFAGGDALRVAWEDGPTVAHVDAITKRYAEQVHDCEADYWHAVSTPFTRNFGGVGYVSTFRDISPATIKALIPWGNARAAENADTNQYAALRMVEDLMGDTDLPAGAVVTGAERRDEPAEEYSGEAYHWRVAFTAPTAATPTAATTASATTEDTAANTGTARDGTFYSVERERDWTWIKFAQKPAADVLDDLRSLGARWGMKRSAWYMSRPIEPSRIVAALA